MKTNYCPCGCGAVLVTQANGRRPLMCADTWKTMPQHLKGDLFSPHSLPDVRRAAARRLIELAEQKNRKRIEGQQLQLSL